MPDRFKIYILENGSLRPSKISYARIQSVTEQRLSVHFEEPYEIDGHGTVAPVKVALTAKLEGNEELELLIESNIPTRESTYYSFSCDSRAEKCEGISSNIIPIESRDAFWFPFDGLRIEHTFKFAPYVKWDEITINNDAGSFVFEPNLSLEEDNNILSLTGDLQRSLLFRLAFVLALVCCCGYLLFMWQTTSRARAQAKLFAVLLALALLLRQGVFQVSLAPFNVVDVSLIFTFIGAACIYAFRRTSRSDDVMQIRKDRAPPANWQDFEDLCLNLLRPRLMKATKNGRLGQEQNGVDFSGLDRRTNALVGIQCKQKVQWPPQVLTIRQIKKEIQKAAEFRPPLSIFIIATTARRDAKSQEFVRRLAYWRRKSGNFSVELLAWDDIQDLLHSIGPGADLTVYD